MRAIQLTQFVSLLAASGFLSLSSIAFAQSFDKSKVKPIEVEALTQTSAELSAELGKKWGRVLTEAYGVTEQGLKMFVDGYANYPQSVLKQALETKNFEAMNRVLQDHNQQLVNALSEKIRNEEGTTDIEMHKMKVELRKALGDVDRDLVYIPVAPCRTFDTRTSSGGPTFSGPVAPAVPKEAYVYSNGIGTNWTVYGGTVASCPQVGSAGPLGGATPYSVAMNVTVITPVGAGWITAYRSDLADPSATVVSKFVQNGVTDTALLFADVNQNLGVAPIKIASRGTTAHVAGDIVGYFIRPQATTLECENWFQTVNLITASGYNSVITPSCSVGRSLVMSGCYSANNYAGNYLQSTSFGDLSPSNVTGRCEWIVGSTGFAATAVSKCCRIPGR
jgi:hypothetical protein